MIAEQRQLLRDIAQHLSYLPRLFFIRMKNICIREADEGTRYLRATKWKIIACVCDARAIRIGSRALAVPFREVTFISRYNGSHLDYQHFVSLLHSPGAPLFSWRFRRVSCAHFSLHPFADARGSSIILNDHRQRRLLSWLLYTVTFFKLTL